MTEKTTINVAGMTCGNCVKAVEENLNRMPGVNSATVDFESGSVEIDFNTSVVGLRRITEVIENLGYDVTT